MNTQLLQKHIKDYLAKLTATLAKFADDLRERQERSNYYKSWTAAKLRKMTEEDLAEYLSKLWAMRIWGNKASPPPRLLTPKGELLTGVVSI